MTDPNREKDAVRRMFAKVMAQWAMDTLELRRSGLNRPGARVGTGQPIGPSEPWRVVGRGYEAGAQARALLVWRPAGRRAA
ncbi:MAG: hypothetical protein GC200_04085 [Tepidisphaera sp.]|nr:hypothetical protein [Tepidisphaera sp.]